VFSAIDRPEVDFWTRSRRLGALRPERGISHLVHRRAEDRAARTSIYSNVVPVVAIAVAAMGLDEPLTPLKIAGAVAVLSGVLLTRLGRRFIPAAPAD
jgi:hypothetical protein